MKDNSQTLSRTMSPFENRTAGILRLYADQPGLPVVSAHRILGIGALKTFYYHVSRLEKAHGYIRRCRSGYEITETGKKWLKHSLYDTPTLGLDETLRCHELLLTSTSRRPLRHMNFQEFVEGDVLFRLGLGEKRRKITLHILQNAPGLDYNGLSLAIAFGRQAIGNLLGWAPRLEEFDCINLQLNIDYRNFRVEGLRAVSSKNLLGVWSRVYAKGNDMRVEMQQDGIYVPLTILLEFLKDPDYWLHALRQVELDKKVGALWRAVEKVQGQVLHIATRINNPRGQNL